MQLDFLPPGLAPGDLFCRFFFLCDGGALPFLERCDLLLVCGLVYRNAGIFLNAAVDEAADDVDLRFKLCQLLLQGFRCQFGGHIGFVHRKQLFPLRNDYVSCLKKEPFDLIFREGRCGTPIPIKLVIALPYDPAVLVCGMPHLGAVPASAVAAHDFAGEDADGAEPVLTRRSSGQFGLNQGKGLLVDDGCMIVLDVVLRHLAVVLLFLLCQKVRRVNLLQQRIALVLFVGQDAANAACVPILLTARCGDSFFGQRVGDHGRRHPGQEHAENAADDLGLFFVDDQVAVRTPVIAEETLEGHGDLPVSKSLSLAPRAVFRDAPALFLGQAGHDRQQQFALGIKGPYPFFFKIDLDAVLFQLPDGRQAVYGIPGEAADRLCDNDVIPLLWRYRSEYMQTRFSHGTAWQGDLSNGGNLFIQADGKLMGHTTPYQYFTKHLHRYNEWVQNNPDKAKAEGLEELPIIPLHGLRHSCATLLNYLEVNIIEISKTLGHSTCSTTMNIYAHSFEEQQEEVATKVNEFLRLNA